MSTALTKTTDSTFRYVTCLAFSSTGDVITGDSNGNVFIWGRGYNAVTKVMRKVHDGPIFSICVLKDGSIITGGGKDSRIVKFDTLYRKTGMEAQLPEHLGSIRTLSQGRGSQLLLGTTKNSILTGNFDLNFQEIMVGHVSDVWALAASPTQPQFISAGHDRMIHLWDTLTHSVVWSNDVGEQVVHVLKRTDIKKENSVDNFDCRLSPPASPLRARSLLLALSPASGSSLMQPPGDHHHE